MNQPFQRNSSEIIEVSSRLFYTIPIWGTCGFTLTLANFLLAFMISIDPKFKNPTY